MVNDRVSSIVVRRKSPFRFRLWQDEGRDTDGKFTHAFTDVGDYNKDRLLGLRGNDNGFQINQTSEVHLQGTGYIVVLYDGDYFTGRAIIIRPDDGLVELKHTSYNFNNQMNSFKIEVDNGQYPRRGRGVATFLEASYDNESDYIADLPKIPGIYQGQTLLNYGINPSLLTRVQVHDDDYEIHLYETNNHRGNNAIIWKKDGMINLNRDNDSLYDMNDNVASIVVRTKGEFRFRAWENDDFDGQQLALSRAGTWDRAWIATKGNNLPDKITMVQIEGNYIAKLVKQNGDTFILFERHGLLDLKDVGFNDPELDRIELIENTGQYPDIGDGAVSLYADDPISVNVFELPEEEVNYTLSDLQAYGYSNDTLTQLRVNNSEYEIWLYEDDNFTGNSMVIWAEDGLVNLKNNTVI
jgi:hypothetical protein